MKRALAERAKQSESGGTTPNGLTPVQVPSGQPPRKLPRIDEQPSQQQQDQLVKTEPVPSAPAPAPPRRSPQTTPQERRSSLKRQRSSPQEEEEGDSSFYLKHQNRALASELKGLQYQLRLLEQERDLRRQHCHDAGQALQTLQNTWTQMEVALQLGMPLEGEESSASTDTPAVVSSDTNQSSADDAGLRNTGSGDSVELVGSLLDSLASLGKDVVKVESSDNNESMDAATQNELRDMKRAASMISQRAATLQKWLWSLLKRVNSADRYDSVIQAASVEGQVASLKGQVRELEARIAELTTTRDEAVESDRRVRRGLYRLKAKRMSLEEVLKAVEGDDKEGTAALMAIETAEEEEVTPSEKAAATVATTGGEEGETVDGAQVLQLKKQLQDLEEIASSRESQIEKLLKEREESSKRINSLSLPKSTEPSAVSEEDVKRSPLYTEVSTKLVTSERQLEELRTRMEKIMEKYATAKGDAELATRSLEDHMDKFKKRWAELTEPPDENDLAELYDDEEKDASDDKGAPLTDSVAQAKRIVELEHQLKQALENVRQADMVRVSLNEAQLMNETLQQKLEEFKVKNAALVAGRTAARSKSDASASAKEKSSAGNSSARASTPVSSDQERKLHKENRQLRKEVSAAVLSKETAKAKQERAEKERDGLMKTNARLLQQSTEKDDMNAKSLSTILHLKGLTEQYEREKVAREQETKNIEQVSLAARLAANAKERVAEEALKEKKLLEDKVGDLEKECERLKHDKEVADGALSQTKAEMSSLEKSVGTVKDRCAELTTESAGLQEEKRKLAESLAVAQRESSEAVKKLKDMKASGSGYSEFTAEQLTAQVSVYKGKLTCPVCNVREKACILLRCRHMFCKACVEENIKNRSRKCPACGGRFDTKDVADIWF